MSGSRPTASNRATPSDWQPDMHVTTHNTVVGVAPARLRKETRTAVIDNGAPKMRLIHEALSRARMLRPQADSTARTEAYRSSLDIALRARRRADRDLSGL